MMFVIFAVTLCFFATCNGVALCLCLRKRKQYTKVRDQTKQLQMNIAASQNMTYHEMVTDPQYPRTLHI